MFHDEFEKEFAESMDDLETINTITIPPPPSATALTTSKLAKFKRLPEIAENSVPTNVTPSPSDILYRVPSDVLAASVVGDLRKTVLINNSANEILSSEFEISQNNDEDIHNNNFTNGSKTDDIPNVEKIADNSEVKPAGARRKFIVTRMDSKILLRPEAENLRNLTAKSNAATISFPCSSSSNRTPLSNLFATNKSFEPHLDRRFFDTSLVRINATSTQSLNTSNASSQDNSISFDENVWEPRKDFSAKPKVTLVVSFHLNAFSYSYSINRCKGF